MKQNTEQRIEKIENKRQKGEKKKMRGESQEKGEESKLYKEGEKKRKRKKTKQRHIIIHNKGRRRTDRVEGKKIHKIKDKGRGEIRIGKD